MTKASRAKIGSPFHPLTEQRAREWYRNKHLSTTGYLLALKGILRPPGVNLVIPNVLAFCREWEITKSAFYRAVNALKASGEMDWEATEGIILKSPKSEKVVSLQPLVGQCLTSGTVSHEREIDSHKRETDSHERETDSHKRETDSHEREEEIYKDRARVKTIQINTDFLQTEADSATATKEAESLKKVEVFESNLHLLEKEQNLTQLDALEANEFEKDKFSASLGLPSESGQKLLTTQGTRGTQQTAHETSALHDGHVLDPEVLKEIELIAYDWRQRPWMASANTFKPDVVQAVWRCNPDWYSLLGSKTPNLKKICDRLRNLDNSLKRLDLDASVAYAELQNYWTIAQTLTNPEVEQAFFAAGAAVKHRDLLSKLELSKRNTFDAIKDL